MTSNDSRIRLYDTCEYRQLCKYKGHQTREAQIRATFSGDGKYVVCGSDQGAVYVWPTVNPLIPAVNPSYTGFRKVQRRLAFEDWLLHALGCSRRDFSIWLARIRMRHTRASRPMPTW